MTGVQAKECQHGAPQDPHSERPDLELEESNPEAVCSQCHNTDHPEKGRKTRQHELPEAPDLSGIRVIKV